MQSIQKLTKSNLVSDAFFVARKIVLFEKNSKTIDSFVTDVVFFKDVDFVAVRVVLFEWSFKGNFRFDIIEQFDDKNINEIMKFCNFLFRQSEHEATILFLSFDEIPDVFRSSCLENVSNILDVKLNNQFDFNYHDFLNAFVADQIVFVVIVGNKSFYSIAEQSECAVLLDHDRNDVTTIFEAILHVIDNESQAKSRTKIENRQKVRFSNDEMSEQRRIVVFLNAFFIVEFASSNDFDIRRIKISIDRE